MIHARITLLIAVCLLSASCDLITTAECDDTADCLPGPLDPSRVRIFAAGSGLRYSPDGGTRWEVLRWADTTVSAVATTLLGDVVVAAVPDAGVFRADTEGLVWDDVTPDGGFETDPFTAVFFSRAGGLLAGAGDRGVFRSEVEGAAWVAPGNEAESGAFHAAVFLESPGQGILAGAKTAGVGSGGGVYRSADGGLTWSVLGPDSVSVTSLSVLPGRSILIGTEAHGIMALREGGGTWTAEPLPAGLDEMVPVRILMTRRFELLLSGPSGLYRSPPDEPLEWTATGFSGGEILTLENGPELDFSTTHHRIYAGGSSGLFLSEDTGTTWNVTTLGTGTVRSLAFSIRY